MTKDNGRNSDRAISVFRKQARFSQRFIFTKTL